MQSRMSKNRSSAFSRSCCDCQTSMNITCYSLRPKCTVTKKHIWFGRLARRCSHVPPGTAPLAWQVLGALQRVYPVCAADLRRAVGRTPSVPQETLKPNRSTGLAHSRYFEIDLIKRDGIGIGAISCNRLGNMRLTKMCFAPARYDIMGISLGIKRTRPRPNLE
jgi:hypothetical protein